MIQPNNLSKRWPIVKLGDVVEFLDSQRKPITAKDRVAGPYPYYGANGQQDSVEGFIFDEPLVLLAEDGGNFGDPSRNIAYQVDGKCWVNNHAHVLRPKKSIDIRYLLRHLEKYDVMRFITGATRAKLNKSAALEILISLPPLPEQKRIAAILDKADAIRRKRQQSIELADQFLRSVFLDMFGDPVTNPKGWVKVKLDELCSIVRGGSPRPIQNFLGGNIPWIKIGDATKGEDIYITSTKEKIIEAGLTKTRLLQPGALIFANCGVSLGFARILKISGCIHDGWLAFDITSTGLNQLFLLKALNQITKHFQAIAPDGTQPNLNTTIMKNFELILPPFQLQEQFEQVVHQVNELKTKYLDAAFTSDTCFNSIGQRAFSGELMKNKAA